MRKLGARVLLWGDSYAATDTAAFLADIGKQVTIVTENREFAADCEVIHMYVLRKRFAQGDAEVLHSRPYKHPVTVITSTTVAEIRAGEVVLQDKDFGRTTLEVDDVVTCHTRPAAELFDELRAAGVNVINVGDSVAPRSLYYAVKEGSAFGLAVDEHLLFNPNGAILNELPIDVLAQLTRDGGPGLHGEADGGAGRGRAAAGGSPNLEGLRHRGGCGGAPARSWRRRRQPGARTGSPAGCSRPPPRTRLVAMPTLQISAATTNASCVAATKASLSACSSPPAPSSARWTGSRAATTAALTTIPSAWPTTRVSAAIPDAVPSRGRGTAPSTALLLGDMNSPCPTPMSARRHASSSGAKAGGRVARLSRPADRSAIPRLAGSRGPIRSDRVPLKGATSAAVMGIGVMRSPASRGLKPDPSWRTNGSRNVAVKSPMKATKTLASPAEKARTPEEAQVHHRRGRAPLDHEEGDPQRAGEEEQSHRGRARPAPRSALVEGEQEGEEARRGESRPRDVERLAPAGSVRRQDPRSPGDGDEPDGHVDQEDRPPRRELGQEAAERGPQRQADRDADGVEAERPAAFARAERAGHDGGAHRHEHRRPDALERAEPDEGADARGQAAQDAGRREDRKSGEVDLPERDHLAQAAEREEQAADDQQVGDDDPLDRRQVDPERPADAGQGDVDDGPVERRHERAERHGREHEPAAIHAANRTPARAGRRRRRPPVRSRARLCSLHVAPREQRNAVVQ